MTQTIAPSLFGRTDDSRRKQLFNPRSMSSLDMYDVEVLDFDMESYYFNEIEASSFEEAARIAESLAGESFIHVYNMNIYQY